MNSASEGDWPIKTLGQVATVVNGGTPKSKVAEYWGGSVQWLTPKDMGNMDGREIEGTPRTITESGLSKSSARLIPANSVILSTRAPIGHLAINEVPMAFNQGCRGLVPKEGLDHVFLYYFLLANRVLLQELGTGTTFKELSANSLKSLPIPLPPLEEQRRIVAVLDEAFEGLDRIHAHVFFNSHNTQDLYASFLYNMVSYASENWISMPVSETFSRIRVPSKIKRRDYLASGEFPIVSQESEFINGYWDDVEDVISIDRPVVIFGDHTRCFKFVDFDFVVGADGTQILAPIDPIEPKFYYYALQAVPIEGKGYARHFTHLKRGEIAFPEDLTEQRKIASTMSDCEAHVTTLSKEYEARLADIDDLRQTVLQRAFSGELT